MKTSITTAALTLSLSLATAAAAAGPRAPIAPQETKETKVELARYGERHEIVRLRSDGREYATFSAEPAAIDADAVMVFEIVSASPKGEIPRWRCIAIDDVSECLGRVLRFRYVVGDDRMVLRFSAQHTATALGAALLAEAGTQQRDTAIIARVDLAR